MKGMPALCGKELCGNRGAASGPGRRFPGAAVAVEPRVLAARMGREVGTLPCHPSRAPRAVPCLLTGSTEVLTS